jgi:hypothetical protein
MSSSPITARIYEKLVFLYGFRICDLYAPEEQWLTDVKYIKSINGSQIICILLDQLKQSDEREIIWK